MSAVRTALVIGGGIAGPVAAMALERAGVFATVCEAYPEASNGIGSALALAANGLVALEIVGAAEPVRAAGYPIAHSAMAIAGKRPIPMPVLDGVEPMRMIDRGDLHRVLHDRAVECGVRYRYDSRLVGAEEHADAITARFADGSTASADILVGADGFGRPSDR